MEMPEELEVDMPDSSKKVVSKKKAKAESQELLNEAYARAPSRVKANKSQDNYSNNYLKKKKDSIL